MDGVHLLAEAFRKEKAEREKEKAKQLTASDLKDALAQFTPPPVPKEEKPKDDKPKDDEEKPKDDKPKYDDAE